jgi:hypothetical protein
VGDVVGGGNSGKNAWQTVFISVGGFFSDLAKGGLFRLNLALILIWCAAEALSEILPCMSPYIALVSCPCFWSAHLSLSGFCVKRAATIPSPYNPASVVPSHTGAILDPATLYL